MKSPKKQTRDASLSAGSSLGASLRRRAPSLAAGAGGKDADGAPESTGSIVSLILRAVAALVFVTLLLLTSAWIVLGVTVLPILRVDGTSWAVKWAAWPEGGVPAGSIIMAETGVKATSIQSRFLMLFDSGDSRAVVAVVAGPGGEVKADPDSRIYINDVPTSWFSDGPMPTTRIGDRYLVVCISGASCSPGMVSLLPISAVLGQVLGSVGVSPSLGPVPTAPAPGIPPPALPMPTGTPVEPESSESIPSSPSPSETQSEK